MPKSITILTNSRISLHRHDQMKKKFLANLLLIVFLNLLIKPFYILGIDAEVQNRVGEAAYGNYFSLLNFSFLLNILLDLGLTNYNTRNIAQNPKLIVNYFYKILSIRLSLFFLYAVFTTASAFLIGYDSTEFYFLFILMINQFLVAIIQFARSNFSGLHLFKSDAFISILDRMILIVLCSILLWTNWTAIDITIEVFIYAQTFAYGIAAIFAVLMLIKKAGRIQFKIKRSFSIVILKRSFPYALLILLMMMYNRIDAVMLERLLPDGDTQAGIYAQGFRLLDAVNMFALLFAGLLLPIFARLIKERAAIKEITELAFRILFGISAIIGITAFLFQEEFIAWRYTDSLPISATTFGWLILSFIPVSITYVFGTLLTANGSLRILNIMALFGVIMNVILNFLLINEMQVVGAALATLITQGITALIQVVFAYKLFKFEINWRLLFTMGSLVGVLMGTYFLVQNIPTISRVQMILPVMLSGVICAFLFGIFKLSDVKQIFQKEN